MPQNTAFQLGAQRLQRAQREGVGGEVALADRGSPRVELAVDHFAAIGVVGPALARRHHVAVGVQRDGSALAVAAAHDQVGDRLQPVVLDLLRRHRVLLGFIAEALQQFGGALGVRRVVARRRVGGHAHQLLQEAHLFVEVGVDPGVEL